MNIDERIWPLPNAFNIREGSPFGKSEKMIKDQEQSIKASKAGQAHRAKTKDTRFKPKAK
jgi:hypothetical protein